MDLFIITIIVIINEVINGVINEVINEVINWLNVKKNAERHNKINPSEFNTYFMVSNNSTICIYS